MPVYVSQEPRKEKKKGGGFSMLGSLLMLAGTATGNPMLTVAGAGMTAADTIARGAEPMQTVSALTQIVGGVQQMQQQKASQSALQQVMATAPGDRAAAIAGTQTPTQSALASAGGLMRSSGEVTSGLADMGPSPMRSKLQLGMLESSLKPKTMQDVRMEHAGTLTPGSDEWNRTMGITVPSPEKPPKPPKILEPPDRDTVYGMCEYVTPTKVVSGENVPDMPKDMDARAQLANETLRKLNFSKWSPEVRDAIAEIVASYFDVERMPKKGIPSTSKKKRKPIKTLTNKAKINQAIASGKIPPEDVAGVREILKEHPEAYKDIIKGYGL